MSENKGTRPTHRAYVAKENSRWIEIGAAWVHKDGKGFRVKLDAIPVDGQIECRVIDWKAKEDGRAEPEPSISETFGEY